MTLFGIYVCAGVFALAAVFAILLRGRLTDFHEFVRRTPKWYRAFLALLAAVWIAYGGGKTNRVGQTGATNGVAFAEGVTNEVDGIEMNTNEIASCGGRGATALPRVASSVSRVASSVSRVASSVSRVACRVFRHASGRRLRDARGRGAGQQLVAARLLGGLFDCSDCSIVRIDSHGLQSSNQAMSFPFGTNEYDSAWAFSWGKLRFVLGDAASEIVAVGAQMAAVPRRSRLWTAVGTNGSRLVTWENFALGRGTDAPAIANDDPTQMSFVRRLGSGCFHSFRRSRSDATYLA